MVRLGSSEKCQQRTSARLFDHLVGSGELRRWDGYAERPRGFKVDDEFKFGGLLHWKIARLLTTKNSIDVLSRSLERIFQVVSIRDEPTGDRNGRRVGEKRWQSISQRQRGDEVIADVGMRNDNNAAVLLRREGRYGVFDFNCIVDSTGYRFDA